MTRFKLAGSAAVCAFLSLPAVATAEVIASDLVNSTSSNLLSFSNPSNGAFSSAGDGFQKYRRGVSPSIPFSVLDDSLSIFTADTLGIVREGNGEEFFGVTDTENADNSGPVAAVWTFNIAGATELALSIDMGAMGDFEASDSFTWSYSIDGGPEMTAFAGTTDESGSQDYTLEGGFMTTLADPMTVQGSNLDNILRTFSTLLSGTGSELTLTLTAQTDGGSEAFAFQNIEIRSGGLPLDVLAFDMVGSASQRLNAHINAFDGAFGSSGDGFQKYQRFVSASIPFAVLDDSLSIFTSDTLGIVREGNTDVFFGVVDTQNGDNSGPVSASWAFDISGGENLGVLVDIGAMGDFESSDFFSWTWSIDGGPGQALFASSVDEAGTRSYTLEGGAVIDLDDPMLLQGVVLSNELATFSAPLGATGSELVLTLTAQFDGGSEAVVFQNLIVAEGFEPPEPTPVAEIWEIQGDGSSSPFDGQLVESLGNVVTALAPDGFFMQTPVGRSDGNVDTSDGIFVFTNSAPAVSVGDLVDVIGTVDEFFGLTEFDDDSVVTVVGSGAAVPAAIVFDASTPSPDPSAPSCAIEFECYEGMLVSISGGTVTGPNQGFGPDPIAEVHITAAGARTFREPGIEFPASGFPGLPVWDGNPEVFELDPDKLGLPNAIIPAGSTFDAVGVIGFEFGGYELWPASLSVTAAPLPVPVRDRARAEFTVGSLNVFRLFDDVDDPSDFDAIGRERDDSVVSTDEYATRRAKFVHYIVDVLDAPDILAIQEVEKLDVLQALAADIAAADPSIAYSAYLVEGNDVGTIDNGFLVRDSVTVNAVTQLGKAELLVFDGETAPLHDRPPLKLEGRVTADGSNFPIAVIGVHNRSLGGIDGSDGARVRQKRLEQAQSIAAMVQAHQDANPDVGLVVTGDFNGFEFSDGFVDVLGQTIGDVDPAVNLLSGPDLVDPDLINQSAWIAAAQRYSFIFRGNAQMLDHALTSMPLDLSVRGLEYGRGNADAAEVLLDDPSTPLASSDHDGLALFITRDRDDDGVFDSLDACPGTMIPESVPSASLGINRFALTDDDFDFDTNSPPAGGPAGGFSTADTAGCSCEQIIDELDLDEGHAKFGCSVGVINTWIQMQAQ